MRIVVAVLRGCFYASIPVLSYMTPHSLGQQFIRLFLAVLLAIVVVNPVTAVGAQRMIVNALEYPWSAIGRVNLGGRGHCTGFLVSERHVLTAAKSEGSCMMGWGRHDHANCSGGSSWLFLCLDSRPIIHDPSLFGAAVHTPLLGSFARYRGS